MLPARVSRYRSCETSGSLQSSFGGATGRVVRATLSLTGTLEIRSEILVSAAGLRNTKCESGVQIWILNTYSAALRSHSLAGVT